MKQLFSFILSLSVAMPIDPIISTRNVRAEENGLYYNVGNHKIPLIVQTDAIAVSIGQNRSADGKSPMSLLQRDFGVGAIRSGVKSSVMATKVQPLNHQYAIVTTIKDPFGGAKLQQQVEKKPYIESVLPVLKIPGRSMSLVLPNETIVKFNSGVSSIDRDAILTRNQFDPKSATELQFAHGFYLVKSTVRGLDILTAANQLGKTPGVQSSMPNFIEVQSTVDRSRFGIRKIGNPQIKSCAGFLF
jgi:serine protease